MVGLGALSQESSGLKKGLESEVFSLFLGSLRGESTREAKPTVDQFWGKEKTFFFVPPEMMFSTHFQTYLPLEKGSQSPLPKISTHSNSTLAAKCPNSSEAL